MCMCLLVLIIACVIDHFLFALKIHLYAVKLWQEPQCVLLGNMSDTSTTVQSFFPPFC